MNQDTSTATTPAAPARRADAGTVRLGERDITGLVLCGDLYGAPYDLLAAALGVRDDRLRVIAARWRKAGYAGASVAEAQAMALTELVAHAATSRDTEPRAMLLACDDYSAVSGRVPLWQLYERGRSLGIGVQVSAQNYRPRR